MSKITLIIGKESNLSQSLYKKLDNCFLVSSREVTKDATFLKEFKNKNIDIIFNNFQPAVRLNDLHDSSRYITNSILSTSVVLDYFKDTDINKIIYTSSSSVYGNNIFCKESDELKPMNLHAALKVANEKLIQKYCMDNKIDYTIARIFNMYGGDDRFSIISKIIKVYENKEVLTIVNRGNAIRDFIHIDDVVDVYLGLLNLKDVKIINVGTGEGNSIKNILDFLRHQGIDIDTKNTKRDELKVSTADITYLKALLNKDKFIEMEEYLKHKFNLIGKI